MPRDDDQWSRSRTVRGDRAKGRDEHIDLCDGLTCPCYSEGRTEGVAEWAALVSEHPEMAAATQEANDE